MIDVMFLVASSLLTHSWSVLGNNISTRKVRFINSCNGTQQTQNKINKISRRIAEEIKRRSEVIPNRMEHLQAH